MLLFQTFLTFLLHVTALVTAADTSAWKSRSIYFVLTDRIARSSSDTGGNACGNLGKYCGGTFQGLQSKLDYIKGLGFDAIWITPVVANSADGYHGYWAQDLYAINSNYGTAADLKSLVSAAHAKGIYIMVDVVANHMGFAPLSSNSPSPLNQPSAYHPSCNIDYTNQNSIETCRIANLPDINTSLPEIRSLFNTWITWLVREYNLDGLRIDTVKHVSRDFWPDFASAAGVYSIGEVFDGNPSYLASYAGLMPGLLNYAVYYPMNNFYQQKGSSQALVDMINTVSTLFPDPAALGTFLDNHDNPRWLAQKNDATLLKNALAFVVLSRGIPILYYGTEQGYAGGADPANREDLWRSGFNTNSDLYTTIAKLTGARRAAGGLPGNDHTHLYVTDTAYAWSRAGGNIVVLTTNAGASSNARHCFSTQKANGRWTDALGNVQGVVSADGSGGICVNVVRGLPVVLVQTDAVPPSTGTTLRTSSTTRSPTTTISTTTPCPSLVAVTFTQRVTTVFGESIRIAGNTPQLGNWNPANAPTLSASAYTAANPVWTITLNMVPGTTVQYKFVKVGSGGTTTTWESDPNRGFTVPRCQASVGVSGTWR
ncbi:hypothetical protein NX059_002729 [Plenodomus lindquistii]|nr:hypothetical protein NX059_002729 [Plenodomus lindquistii]